MSDVDALESCAISGGLCDLDRVVSDIDTVVSGAVTVCMCDLESVSSGDTVVRVGEKSLSRGGDAVVSGVDEPVWGVSSVMTADEFDVCVVGTA